MAHWRALAYLDADGCAPPTRGGELDLADDTVALELQAVRLSSGHDPSILSHRLTVLASSPVGSARIAGHREPPAHRALLAAYGARRSSPAPAPPSSSHSPVLLRSVSRCRTDGRDSHTLPSCFSADDVLASRGSRSRHVLHRRNDHRSEGHPSSVSARAWGCGG